MVRKSSANLRTILAENIREFRKSKGYSQEDLAGKCGLHRTYIGSVERRERNVTLSTLEVVASTLEVSVPQLLSRSEHVTRHRGRNLTNLSGSELDDLIDTLQRLTSARQNWVKSIVHAFESECEFYRYPESDIVTNAVLTSLGDRLISHHANSRQALSKDRFEFAFEAALNAAGIPARLEKSRTNRGHDITIRGVPVSLKTEAAKAIKEDFIHVSKWMELGRGKWQLGLLLKLFLEHMQGYERIFTLRRLKNTDDILRYELVEIPKELLLEAKDCELEVRTKSRQSPKPGYGYVRDSSGSLKYSLYFDAGTERKLQIKHLRKSLCIVHARWKFKLVI